MTAISSMNQANKWRFPQGLKPASLVVLGGTAGSRALSKVLYAVGVGC